MNTDVYDTAIPTLGKAAFPSSHSNQRFVDDARPLTLMMTSQELAELGAETLPLQLEKAGPRQRLFFDPAETTCAIVTCGGLCPGINDVIRAIVMEAHYSYGIKKILGVRNGLRGFIPEFGYEVERLTPKSVSHIHHLGGTILGSSRGPQDPGDIVESLERLEVDVLFCIGGDGTMRATKAIQEEIAVRDRQIAVIGIPKTIDNDINFITSSFGFDTAVEKATEAIQCAHVEATGLDMGIGMVKLMGREAGFIAAQATLAMQEVNVVLVPEERFELEGDNGLLMALERRLQARRHAVLVCAEGAGQHLLQTELRHDPSGNRRLGDVCGMLCDRIKQHFVERDIEMTLKFIDPSYIIRSVPANAGDRVYCGFLGQNAVHAAMAGKTGMVVALLKTSMVHLPLDLVTAKRRTLNIESDFWSTVMEATGQRDFFYPK